MKVQCKNCLQNEVIDIPDFKQAEKIELHELNLTSPLQTVRLLMDKFKIKHIDAKYIVTHINKVYGHCNRCSYHSLDEEYIKYPKCGALNFNWKTK